MESEKKKPKKSSPKARRRLMGNCPKWNMEGLTTGGKENETENANFLGVGPSAAGEELVRKGNQGANIPFLKGTLDPDGKKISPTRGGNQESKQQQRKGAREIRKKKNW